MQSVSITVPGVTSVVIMVSRWLVADGERVWAGRAVCELEILSPYGRELAEATLELESPADGILRYGLPAGCIVAMGQEVARVEG